MMKNSLATKIFKYLSIFSIFILLFLFFFQVIFINSFYEYTKTKTKTIKRLANNILIGEDASSLYEKLDRISYKEDVCIELTDNNGNILYSASNKSCRLKTKTIKRNFIYNNKNLKLMIL